MRKIVTLKEKVSFVLVAALQKHSSFNLKGMNGNEIVELIHTNKELYDVIERVVDVFGDFDLDEICEIIEEYYYPDFLEIEDSSYDLIDKYYSHTMVVE